MRNDKKSFFICNILLFFSSISFAQIRTTEIGVITDNDLYTSSRNDMYYTNGLTFYYRYLGKIKTDKILKSTNEITVGQYVYTPKFLNATAVDINDRPFGGYLFAGFGKSFFYQNQNVLKVSLQGGTIGPNSYAEGFQKNFHKAFHYKKVYGWENQIQNALALQSHIQFSKKLFPNSTQKIIDFNWQSEADLGTIFTGVNTGLVSRIGFKKLLPIYDSNVYGGSVGTTKLNYEEFYFYVAPSVRYQIYDATIQGSLFNDNSPVTFDIVPFRFNAKAGFVYRKNNFNFSYLFVYTTKEVANSPAKGFYYGSIGISFLLQ
jgi:lipid A 3-O-deacylase